MSTEKENEKISEAGSIKTLKYKYIFNDDYNPVYVNGVYGGFTSKNELNANFFLERGGLPNHKTYSVEDGLIISKPIERDPDLSKEHLLR